jgi:hypothetical protein
MRFSDRAVHQITLTKIAMVLLAKLQPFSPEQQPTDGERQQHAQRQNAACHYSAVVDAVDNGQKSAPRSNEKSSQA